MREIAVTGGSVQLTIAIGGRAYLVDLWKQGDGWRWTARRPRAAVNLAQGEMTRWSDARTAAFRACLRESRATPSTA